MCRSAVHLAAPLLAALAACHEPPPPAPPAPRVRVAAAVARSIEETHEWLATLDGSVNAEIRPQVNGYLQTVDYREGNVVDEGTLLFTVDPRPFQAAVAKAEADVANAAAQLHKSRGDVARYAPLAAEHAISREQLDDARAAVRVNRAMVGAARANLTAARLNLGWTRVRSPIHGLAGIAQTRVGNLVSPNQVLTVVSTIDPIRVSFNISEKDYLRYARVLNHVNEPQYANRRWIELVLIDGYSHPYNARHIIVNRQIDPATGTLLVQALFPNPDHFLRPGLFAKVRVHTAITRPVILVPEVAVQQLQGQSRVAVVDEQGKLHLRDVELGRQIGHRYVIERGVQAGERVVTEGLQNAQPGQTVQVVQAPADAAAAAPIDGGVNGAAADLGAADELQRPDAGPD